MYTASPHFKAQRTLGDEFDRLSSKVSLKINYIMQGLCLSNKLRERFNIISSCLTARFFVVCYNNLSLKSS